MNNDEMKMDDGMNMDMNMDMSMVMTFGKFSDYKLKLLFESWNITNRWEFALSWIAVVVAAIVYHAIKDFISKMEMELRKTGSSSRTGNFEVSLRTGLMVEWNKMEVSNGSSNQNSLKVSRYSLLILHAFMSALNYGLALMLMLVAMTYNPTLFLALLVGYFLGTFLFADFRAGTGPKGGNEACCES